jgi:itaconyl-CoA hydratase
MTVTSTGSYFEDFSVGMEVLHRRSRTLYQEENARWSLQTMNTAQSHWNHESMKTYLDGRFQNPIVNAAIVIALAAGLTSGDMTENIFREIGVDGIRISTPVFAGDTLTAVSTVLEVNDATDTPHSGKLRYKIAVHNQKSESVLTMERTVLVKRRSHWAERDAKFSQTHWQSGES